MSQRHSLQERSSTYASVRALDVYANQPAAIKAAGGGQKNCLAGRPNLLHNSSSLKKEAVMLRSIWPRTRILSITLAFLSGTSGSARDFEVWLVDQSDSFGKAYGGTIHIYDGAHLNGNNAASVKPTDVLDLGSATAQLCFAQTGAYPVRSHMLAFNATHSHAMLTIRSKRARRHL
jgi:hypothetical protein